ncbi:hypothetical protein, partial [Shewanella algae]|uniref:hypothetical protein n=1 Tax=Shewanella algae TaxID=38313 RepID=UPI00313CA699
IGAGLVSAGAVKPVIDTVTQLTSSKKAQTRFDWNEAVAAARKIELPKVDSQAIVHKLEEQIPLTQAQIDRITKALGENLTT